MFLVLGLPLVMIFLLSKGSHVKKTVAISSPMIPNPDGSPDSVYSTVGNFSFLSQTGATVTQDTFLGSIYVADVFYTSSKGVSLAVNNGLKMVQDYFKDYPEVKLLSISLDPERDSVEALAKYAESFQAIDHKWYFLTGNKADLHSFALQGFNFKTGGADEESSRSAQDKTLRLIDKEGRLRGDFYDVTRVGQVDTLIDHIKLLQIEYAQEK